MDVFLVGPVPTPAVSMLTRSIRADIGIMISASHNPYCDNGIKIFTRDGHKLSDEIEREIEALIEGDITPHLAAPQNSNYLMDFSSFGGLQNNGGAGSNGKNSNNAIPCKAEPNNRVRIPPIRSHIQPDTNLLTIPQVNISESISAPLAAP